MNDVRGACHVAAQAGREIPAELRNMSIAELGLILALVGKEIITHTDTPSFCFRRRKSVVNYSVISQQQSPSPLVGCMEQRGTALSAYRPERRVTRHRLNREVLSLPEGSAFGVKLCSLKQTEEWECGLNRIPDKVGEGIDLSISQEWNPVDLKRTERIDGKAVGRRERVTCGDDSNAQTKGLRCHRYDVQPVLNLSLEFSKLSLW